MKSRPSYRSLLLIAGIVVAMVIAFTTWMYSDRTSASSQRKDVRKPRMHAQSMIQKLIRHTEVQLPAL